jgi:hypothetical protein
MQQYLRELKKLFYSREWEINPEGTRAIYGGITLWIGNGAYYFTGYKCALHIPIMQRAYMFKHFRIGQGDICVKRSERKAING